MPRIHSRLTFALAAASIAAQEAGEVSQAQQAIIAATQQLQALAKVGDPSRDRVLAAARAARTAYAAMGAAERGSQDSYPLILELAEAALQIGQSADSLAWLSDLEQQPASASLPEDRRLAASFYIALALNNLGRLPEARDRLLVVEERLSATAPAGAALLLRVRSLLARIHYQARDWRKAETLQEGLVAHWRAAGQDQQQLLQNLAQLGRIRHRLGNRQGAFEAFEECLTVIRQLLPDDHLAVQVARQNLSSSMAALGDYHGAYELLNTAFTHYERLLPPDDRRLLQIKQGLSQLLVQLGELTTARRLQAEVLERVEKGEPRDEAMLVLGQQHYARILHSLRDYEAAYEVAKTVVETLSRTRPDHDRDLNTARMLVGVLERRRDDLPESRRQLEAAFDGISQILPMDHSLTQIACAELISTCRLLGDTSRAIELATALHDAALASMQKTLLAARPTGQLASIQNMGLDHALSIAIDEANGSECSDLSKLALRTSQLLRGIQSRVARSTNQVRWRHKDEVQRLEEELQATINEQQAASEQVGEGGDRLASIVLRRERIERELLTLAAVQQDGSGKAAHVPTVAELAASLPARSAAVAIVSFKRRTAVPDDPSNMQSQQWLVALVLHGSGEAALVDLGSHERMLDRVDNLRMATHKQLRRAVLDPVLAAAGDVDAIYLALDECLQLVPLAALPLDSGELIGSAVELRRVTSLLDLVTEDRPQLGKAPSLLAIGGLDYQNLLDDGQLDDGQAVLEGSVAPPLTVLRGSEGGFPPIAASRLEVDQAVSSFQAEFPAARTTVLDDNLATKQSLAQAVRGTTVVHMATHGFFAAEDAENAAPAVRWSPFMLCGLALSGANLGPNADGMAAGILTGDEVMRLDLTSCYLAVLSACDSAQGARSKGQGHASLHEALHSAGARFVISSMWQVHDRAAQSIMAEFYRQLWQHPELPHRALWAAKMAARRDGVPFRDWAAFLVTGT